MMDDSDSMIPCPYNKSHMLYKSRMQTHLMKCSYTNQHPQQNVDPLFMKICRFNTNHHVPATEYADHCDNCPDGDSVHRFVTMCNSGQGSAIPYKEIYLPPTEENWDDCEDVSTYNPEEHATTGVILRAAQGVPKAERKTFRLRERERINRLRETEETAPKMATKTKAEPTAPAPSGEKHAFMETSLRHPKAGQLGMGRGRNGPIKSALSGDDDCAVQGIGRAYTLRGMNNGLQNVPAMRPKLGGGTSRVATSSVATSSVAINGSGPESGHSSSAHSGEDANAFIEQKSKKNKKKQGKAKGGAAPNAVGQAPSGANAGQTRPSNNPLTEISGGAFSFPGLPGKGRGRIRKN